MDRGVPKIHIITNWSQFIEMYNREWKNPDYIQAEGIKEEDIKGEDDKVGPHYWNYDAYKKIVKYSKKVQVGPFFTSLTLSIPDQNHILHRTGRR